MRQENAAGRPHKIMGMDGEKRQRLLNAAMAEFCKGYQGASTDEIVRKAGISKGLLFHYFGTKENLYRFLVSYTLDEIVQYFTEFTGGGQTDILDRLWRMAQRKRELCGQYPLIFEFMTASYYAMKDDPRGEFARQFDALQKSVYTALYRNLDASLLKEEIDAAAASNIIRWTLAGLTEKITGEKKSFSEMQAEYDGYMEETKRYLDLLRSLLYR